ncbi:MAG: hypothetical protein ACKOZM_01380 [Flavobacteriales bacterium]
MCSRAEELLLYKLSDGLGRVDEELGVGKLCLRKQKDNKEWNSDIGYEMELHWGRR